jgi:hypothetical protein
MNNFFNKLQSWLLSKQSQPLAGKQEAAKQEPEFDWQYLVTPGHVIFARMNELKSVGNKLLILLIVTLALFYFAFTASVKLILASTSPHQISEHAARQIINSDQIIDGSLVKSEIKGKLTKSFDLPAFINQTLTSLNINNKLAVPCNTSNSLKKQWASKEHSVEYPMCLTAKSSSNAPPRVYIFAVIDDGDGNTTKNWLGIFINESKYFGLQHSWVYKTVEMNGFLKVPEFPIIDSNLIVNTLKADFPDLPTSSTVSKMQQHSTNTTKQQMELYYE